MQIIINDVVIPFSESISLPLVLRSPLFLTSENRIPGSYIFNTQFPATEALRKVFGQAHRVQRHERATAELPFTIISGLLRYQGKCIITQASSDYYDIVFYINGGDFNSKISGLTLKDLYWGDDIKIADLSVAAFNDYQAIALDELSYTYHFNYSIIFIDLNNNLSFSAPIGAHVFNCKNNADVKMTLNFTLSDADIKNYSVRLYKNGILYQSFQLTYGFNDITIETATVVGDNFYWAMYAEKKSEGLLRFKLTDIFASFESNNVFNSVALLDQNTSDYTIFPIKNASFMDNFPDDAFQIDNVSIKQIHSEYATVLNYFKDGKFALYMVGKVEDETFYCANLFTPFVYMRTILSKIAQSAGYAIINNPFDSESFANMVLFNAYAENNYAVESAKLLPTKPTFNLSDHVPNLKQSDFVRYVSILTGYMPVFDSVNSTINFIDIKSVHQVSNVNSPIPFSGIIIDDSTVKVDPEYAGIKIEITKASQDKYLDGIKEFGNKLVYKGEVAHINQLPSVGNQVNDMFLVTALNEYYVYQYLPESYTLGWWFYSKKYPVSFTEGKEPYLSYEIAISPLLTTTILDDNLSAPENRTWNIPVTEQPGILEGFPDSFATEYGLQALIYRGMAKDSLNQDYPCAIPIYSVDQLIANRYDSFLRWIAYETKPVTIRAILTREQLRKIRHDRIYAANGFNFLIKELRINLGIDGLSMAEIDIYTV